MSWDSDPLGIISTPSWWSEALCRGQGVQVKISRPAGKDSPAGEYYDNPWFPERGGSDATTRALNICWGVESGNPCTVRLKCLAEGLDADNPIAVGVWGGHTVRERRKIKQDAEKGSTLEAASARIRAGKLGRKRGRQRSE